MSIDNSLTNRRIAKNSILLSFRMVFVLLIGLYTTRAVLSLLGVEDYGVYNVVCGFVSMFAFLNTSMINGIQRFFNFEYGKNGEEGANKVFNTALLIQICLVIIILILTESVGVWYLHNKMVIPEGRMIAAEWIFHFSILSFVFVILQVPYGAAIMAHEQMDYYALVNIVDAVLKLAIVLIIPYLKGNYLIIYGILWSLISLFDFLMYMIYARKKFSEIRINAFFCKKTFTSMLGFSIWNLFGSLSGVMKEQGINIVMNLFFGPVVNAARGIAAQVNGGVQGFASNIMISVRPQVVQSYAKGDIVRTMSLTFSISKLSCYVLYIIALPVIIEIDYILNFWLGANIPNHTSTFILIVLFTSFVGNLNSAISNVVHASGIMRLYQIVGGVIGLLSVPVAYGALKLGGSPESAMWVAFASMTVTQINAIWILKTIVNYSIRNYIYQVLIPIFSVIITTAFIPLIPYYLMETGFIRLCVVGVISVLSVITSIYLFGLNISEKEIVVQMVKKKLKKKR